MILELGQLAEAADKEKIDMLKVLKEYYNI